MNFHEAVAETKKIVNNLIPDMLIMDVLRSIQNNDEAHNLDHVVKVIRHAHKLCDNYRPELNFKTRCMVLTGALCHDLGCAYDRKTHHFISYGLVFKYLEDYGERFFSQEEIKMIAESCLEHRASFKGIRTHIVSELVALADRGELDKKEYIKRSIQFHTNNVGRDKPAVLAEVCQHIPDKFGENGYNWPNYPDLGFKIYKEKIKSFKEFADNPEEVKRVVLEVMDEMNY